MISPNFLNKNLVADVGDSFLGHIAGKSGAQVGLKGMGSGTGETGEPLHILVSATSQQTIDEAVR